MELTLYTIGHSTHPIEEFTAILHAYAIQTLVDVRTVPKSRHNPQFNEAELGPALSPQGIAYARLAGLGGLRHASKESTNTAWKNASFRGYADYMQTPEFERALEELIALAQARRVAVMCAEAVPWRCHRSLIGDALMVRGFQVVDILAEKFSRPHKMTPWAVVEGTRVTYPGPPPGE